MVPAALRVDKVVVADSGPVVIVRVDNAQAVRVPAARAVMTVALVVISNRPRRCRR